MAKFARKDFVDIDGDLVRKALEKKGLSLAYVEKIIGARELALSNWTRRGRMDGKYVDQLCVICDISKDKLIKPEKEETVEEKKPEPVQIVRSEIGKPDMSASIPPHLIPGDEQSTFSHIDVMLNLLQDSIEVNSGIMKQIQKDNAELREMLKTTIDILMAREKVDVMQLGAITMELCDGGYKRFKKEASEKANTVISKKAKYKTTNQVFSDVYQMLRAEYGVVWEQEKKEFVEVNGYPPASTLQLCYWIEANKPAYHNLFLSKLDTLAK